MFIGNICSETNIISILWKIFGTYIKYQRYILGLSSQTQTGTVNVHKHKKKPH